MKKKNCVIYTRVSTDAQAEKEFSSCESQEQKIRSFVDSQNGWQVIKVYSDPGFTGANMDRPALQQMIFDLKEKDIDFVLAYKIDRLSRSPKDFYQLIESFEQAKIDFISITERFDTSTPAGRLLRNIMLTFAQFERELVSERVRDKMLERAKKGLYNGGSAPYGYKRENKKIVPSFKESEIIKSIFEKYLETQSLSKVYLFLKENNIKSRQGNIFFKTVLGYILRNPVYAGKVKHNNIIYQGLHKSVISQELFNLAQKIHKTRLKNFRVYKNFLFGGLVKCEECGYKMSSSFSNKKNNLGMKRYYYYRCNSTTKKDWDACSVKQVSAERIENYILENLERISIDQTYIENLVFKLNHSLNTAHRVGHELTDVCSKFFKISGDEVTNTLKFFLSTLKNKKGIEKNISAKKFINKITYSPVNIKIKFKIPPFVDENDDQKTPSPPEAGRKKIQQSDDGKPIFNKDEKFETSYTAAGLGLEPR
ncbi:recombinase family protein [Patescibacteria group bacterium]|nr:recombinase family protein [Patescibacteria group bacterium]